MLFLAGDAFLESLQSLVSLFTSYFLSPFDLSASLLQGSL